MSCWESLYTRSQNRTVNIRDHLVKAHSADCLNRAIIDIAGVVTS